MADNITPPSSSFSTLNNHRSNSTIITTAVQKDDDDDDNNNNNISNQNNTKPPFTKQSSACTCTKISVMQLFHEMKQKFATVPDHIVCQYVKNNCHNRIDCISALEKIAESYPGSVQAYPQALRNNTMYSNSKCKKLLVPHRPPPSVPVSTVGGGENNNVINKTTYAGGILSNSDDSNDEFDDDDGLDEKTIIDKCGEVTLSDNKTSDMVQSNNSYFNSNNSNDSSSCSNSSNCELGNKPKVPQRPTTLNISNVPIVFPRSNASSVPVRPAPPPPLHHPQRSTFNSPHHQNHSVPTDSCESLNVSLNVTVSPVSARPPIRPGTRHTSALSLQPELAFNRISGSIGGGATSVISGDDRQHSPRSYTSVNFTLRQPATSPQSPIDITAGPSLKYSSASYDARIGYQSRLEITVGGGGGSICASRTRPRNNFMPPSPVIHTSDEDEYSSAMMRPKNSHSSIDEAEIVHRQLLCKHRLSVELENDRNRLYLMQRELRTLQAPLPAGGSLSLADEIERLRYNCKQMVQEVEEAGPSYIIGETNEAFYQNIYTGQRLPIQQSRQPRPPRPPAPLNVPRSITHTTNHNYSSNSSSGSAHPADDYDTGTNQDGGGQPWTCNMCTFQNHPLLNKCEQCDMPHLTTSGTVPTTLTNPNNSFQRTQSLISTPPPIRLQHMSYQQQSAQSPIEHNPFQYNPATISFNDLPQLAQQN